MLRVVTDMLADLDDRIADLDKEIARQAREDEVARRLMTIPDIGPIAATVIVALAPSAETFTKGRDFAAWLGLAPRQHSTGGKQKLGRISKMGERTIRRLLIIGGSSVVRQATIHGAPTGSWLERMLARKRRMLVSVALANKMACTAWALMTRNEDYSRGVSKGSSQRRRGRRRSKEGGDGTVSNTFVPYAYVGAPRTDSGSINVSL